MSELRVVPYHQGEWLSFHGIPVEIIADAEMTGGRFMLSRGFAHKGAFTPPHRHAFGEAFYALSGKQHYRAAGDEATLEAGQFIHIPGGVAHQPNCLSDEVAEVLVICFPAGFDAFQRAVGVPMAGPDALIPPEPGNFMERAKHAAALHGIELGLPESDFAGRSGVTWQDVSRANCTTLLDPALHGYGFWEAQLVARETLALGSQNKARGVYVLEGRAMLGELTLDRGSFAYLPPGCDSAVEAAKDGAAQVLLWSIQ
jgi:quercetin dioxygenase-like cupin family protein